MIEKFSLPKQWLSHSQINMFLRCPKQYEFSYVRGIKIPPAGMLVLGSAGHSAIAYNYTQKIETHKDLKPEDVIEYFVEEFDKRVEEEEPIFDEDKPGDLKDIGVLALNKYQKDKAISIQPREVEKEFVVEFNNVDYFIKGFIDLITIEDSLVDHKMSKKSPNQHDIDEQLQMTVYKLGYRCLYGRDPAELRFDYLITSRNPQVKSYSTSRSDEDIAEYLELVGQVVEYIKRGDFYKNTQGYWCSKKYCGYYDICRPHRVNKFYDFVREEVKQ